MENNAPRSAGGGQGSAARPTPRVLSRDLFREGRRLIIEHEGKEYALLITRQRKLVLNRC